MRYPLYSVVQLVGQLSLAGITSSLLLMEVQQTAHGMLWLLFPPNGWFVLAAYSAPMRGL